MTQTDAILRAIAAELECWRPVLDRQNGIGLDSLRVVVYLNPKLGVPRRVTVAPETNRELAPR